MPRPVDPISDNLAGLFDQPAEATLDPDPGRPEETVRGRAPPGTATVRNAIRGCEEPVWPVFFRQRPRGVKPSGVDGDDPAGTEPGRHDGEHSR